MSVSIVADPLGGTETRDGKAGSTLQPDRERRAAQARLRARTAHGRRPGGLARAMRRSPPVPRGPRPYQRKLASIPMRCSGRSPPAPSLRAASSLSVASGASVQRAPVRTVRLSLPAEENPA